MTDDQLDQAISEAMELSDEEGLSALTALRDRLQVDEAPDVAAMAQLWEAIVEISRRSGDEAASLPYVEGRARWLAAVLGPSEPQTLEAWLELGDSADLECQWDVATRAWEAVIAATSAAAEVDAARPSISRALRGLGTRRMVDGRLGEARALFEQDLAANQQRYPGGHPQVAISLDNVAHVLEQLGDRDRALEMRRRQRDTLAAAGAGASQLAAVDQHVSRLASA
jgi:tetratricopeptide (TPR) repeat protein